MDRTNADQLRKAIAAAQAGKAEGFQSLLESYGPRLYGYFFRATGDAHEAEDLVGTLMLRLIRRLKHYSHRDRFEPWLFRIAANMVRDRIRRVRARPTTMSLSAESDTGQTMADHLHGRGEPPDSGPGEAERARQLHLALEKLDLTTREMILLRYFGEMRFKELAEVFQCPIGTALARVHRGLKALRDVLGHA